MLEKYFKMPMRLRQLRSSPFAPHLDGFAEQLGEDGYAPITVRAYVVAAEHLGIWLDREERSFAEIDEATLRAFVAHFPCMCRGGTGGRSSDVVSGPRRFLEHLRDRGIASHPDALPADRDRFPMLGAFQRWMVRHRGVSEATISAYERVLVDLLSDLGEDTSVFTTTKLRQFVLERARRHGTSKAKLIVTAVRMFLRYLVAHGHCDETLIHAIPTIPRRRLAALPRHLRAEDVERLVESCDLCTPTGVRDRAVIVLLARLGLRAGDVVGLCFDDIDWMNASLRVCGKGRREVRLPLPQDVGDAILTYLGEARPTAPTDRIFYRSCAPRRPLSSGGVSGIVRAAMSRAEIVSPCRGAHVLRHSAATKMLAGGASLQAIGAVLRHRSIETTNLYAKVDVALLRQIAQPWPREVTPC